MTGNQQDDAGSIKRTFDLEERMFLFARDVANYCKKLSDSLSNREYKKQVLRSSASIGANYIEANDGLGHKDFIMRLRIGRKEARESSYWLRLLVATNTQEFEVEGNRLRQEATELKLIIGSIIEKCSKGK